MLSCRDPGTYLVKWRNVIQDYKELKQMHNLSGVSTSYFQASIEEKFATHLSADLIHVASDSLLLMLNVLAEKSPHPI